jgi:hypothetical protein
MLGAEQGVWPMKEPWVIRALRAALYGVFAAGAATLAALPLLLDHLLAFLQDGYAQNPGYRAFILSFLYVAGLLALWSVVEMLGMLRTVRSQPFVGRNVRGLKRVGGLFLGLAALFLGKCLWFPTVMTLLCGVALLCAALFAFTLSHLFGQAVAFREENDLTI